MTPSALCSTMLTRLSTCLPFGENAVYGPSLVQAPNARSQVQPCWARKGLQANGPTAAKKGAVLAAFLAPFWALLGPFG